MGNCPGNHRVLKSTLLSVYLLAWAALIAWGLGRLAHDATAAWVAFLVPAAFIPLIAYGRFYVAPEHQDTFKRSLYRALALMLVVIVVGSFVFVVYLVGKD